MELHQIATLATAQAASGALYLEFLREASMSIGLYVLAAGATDGQSPHTEDEAYVVPVGRSRFTAGDETRDVGPGDTIFVAGRVPHRFHDIMAERRLIVPFAPPVGSVVSG